MFYISHIIYYFYSYNDGMAYIIDGLRFLNLLINMNYRTSIK